MSRAIVEIQDLSFSFNGQPVLQDIYLEVKKGDFLAMIGPNGGGKTTLLKIMLGLFVPDKGSVRVLGRPPQKASHRIGYVPQDVDINLRFPVSALDVALMGNLKPGKGWSRPSHADRIAAHRALEQLDMPFIDILASCDVLIAKPGYGSFTEAACHGLPVLYVPREDWPEAPYLTGWLHEHARALEVPRRDLETGRFADALDALLAQPARPPVQPSGIAEAADILAEQLKG